MEQWNDVVTASAMITLPSAKSGVLFSETRSSIDPLRIGLDGFLAHENARMYVADVA